MKPKCINFLFDSWCFELFDGRSFLVCHLVSVLRPCFSLRYISHFSSFYTIYETWFLHPTSDWQYFDLQINLGWRPLYSVASCHQRPRWDCFPSDSSFIFCKVSCFSFICVSHIFPSWLVGIVYFYCMRSVLCGTPWIIAKELKHQSMPMKNWSKKDSYCLPLDLTSQGLPVVCFRQALRETVSPSLHILVPLWALGMGVGWGWQASPAGMMPLASSVGRELAPQRTASKLLQGTKGSYS